MPIAVAASTTIMMAPRSDSPSSPSQRMTKAQFFRARSPPGPASGGPSSGPYNNNIMNNSDSFARTGIAAGLGIGGGSLGGNLIGHGNGISHMNGNGAGPVAGPSSAMMDNRDAQGYASSIGTLGHTPPMGAVHADVHGINTGGNGNGEPPYSSRSQLAYAASSRLSHGEDGRTMPASAPLVGRAQSTTRSSNGPITPDGPHNGFAGNQRSASDIHKQLPQIITNGTSEDDQHGYAPALSAGPAHGMEMKDSASSWAGGTGMAAGSDEMLMTLLASQAAVDCEQLPLGGWEEVDAWKKELSLLSTRLSSLVARHQREIKILAAARTLQKLNHSNKRMSKQTLESLEQSEKRVEAAEKEVLILRDRESSLRRRLNEHWAGVMAWEVRRLGKISAEAQARYERQAQVAIASQAKEREMASQKAQALAQLGEVQSHADKHRSRADELEEIVLELGRRERALEQDMQEADRTKSELTSERDTLAERISQLERDRGGWEAEKRRWEQDRETWAAEKRDLSEKHFAMAGERERLLQEGVTSPAEKESMERVRSTLSQVLGRSTVIREHELVGAVEQVKSAVERKDREVVNLRGEMQQVTAGLEEEVRRVAADRDAWKEKLDKTHQAHREEASHLQKQSRNLSEQVSDLSLRNESLSASLQAAQAALSSTSSSSASTKSLQNRVDALTAELDSIAGQFSKVWKILPSPSTRSAANLSAGPLSPTASSSSRVPGASPRALVSPTMAPPINFAALQAMYRPEDSRSGGQLSSSNGEKFGGIDEMVSRIRGMVEDGRTLVDRMIRLDREREMHKTNSAKAKKLVEDSRASLETYQKQVAVLEDRLAKSGATESHFLEELNSLRASLDAAAIARRSLETQVAQQSESAARLQKANDTLSARALQIADEAEREKRAAMEKIMGEMTVLKRKLKEAEEAGDEERSRSQAQRIQLLDELNSLQAEVGELRKQLRQARSGA